MQSTLFGRQNISPPASSPSTKFHKGRVRKSFVGKIVSSRNGTVNRAAIFRLRIKRLSRNLKIAALLTVLILAYAAGSGNAVAQTTYIVDFSRDTGGNVYQTIAELMQDYNDTPSPIMRGDEENRHFVPIYSITRNAVAADL